MVQLGGFLGKLLGPLIKPGLPLTEDVLKPLAKNVLVLLRLMSATDVAIQNKIVGSGTTTLIFLFEELNDIIKITKSLEDSGLLIKVLLKQLKMK